MQQQQFVGLTMPVFTAFGWAGEETALNFALTQLETFISRLHAALPRDIQTRFPFAGLDRASQSVFLAAGTQIESAAYITFFARPLSLEMQYTIRDKMTLSTAWKAAEGDPERWRTLMQDLDPGWSLRVQQIEVDEESGQTAFYQDLFKDDIAALDLEKARDVASRAAFLNGEPKWLVTQTLSFRVPSEQVAMMGVQVIDVASEWLEKLMPLHDFLAQRTPTPVKKRKRRPAAETAEVAQAKAQTEERALDQFTYIAKLKPLHIRRGFVNLTPQHWEFFATSARATTRDVTLAYEERKDYNSSVWRLSHNDQARIVLSPVVRMWLEETFEPEDKVQVTASKLDDEEIEVRLEAVE